MKKSELRIKYLELRKTLSKDEVLILSERIFERFVSRFQPIENKKVHIFLSIPKFKEVETDFFIDYFFEKNIKVFVPKMIDGKIIAIEFTNTTEMETNSWGISEPKTNEDSNVKDFDFVITPLLYCDKKGNRVGYGKGFYDRFFSEINSNALKVGVGFFSPDETIEDLNENDIPLDYLVTPDTILSFNGLL